MSTSLDQKFTADASQIEAAFEKIKRHNQDLLTQLQKLKQETKQGHEEANRGEGLRLNLLKDVKSELLGIAAGVLSVNSVIGLITDAYQQWKEKTAKLAEDHERIAKAQLDSARASGKITEADDYAIYTGAIQTAGYATKEQASRARGAIGGTANNLDNQTQERLTTAGIRALPLVGDSGLEEYEKLIGNLTDFNEELAKKSPGEFADLALKARELAGTENATKFGSEGSIRSAKLLMGTGALDEATVLGLSLSAAKEGANPMILGAFADSINKKRSIQLPAQGQRLSEAQRANNRLKRMTPEQRAEALLNDERLAAGEFGDRNNEFQLAKKNYRQFAPELRAALAPGDYVGQQLQRSGKSLPEQLEKARAEQTIKQAEFDQKRALDADISKIGSEEFERRRLERWEQGNWNPITGPLQDILLQEEIRKQKIEPLRVKGLEDIERSGEKSQTITDGLYEKQDSEFRASHLEKAANDLLGAAALINRTFSKSAPANPIDVRARGESR